VGPYPHEFACTATIHGVTIELLGEVSDATREAVAVGMLHAEAVTQ